MGKKIETELPTEKIDEITEVSARIKRRQALINSANNGEHLDPTFMAEVAEIDSIVERDRIQAQTTAYVTSALENRQAQDRRTLNNLRK